MRGCLGSIQGVCAGKYDPSFFVGIVSNGPSRNWFGFGGRWADIDLACRKPCEIEVLGICLSRPDKRILCASRRLHQKEAGHPQVPVDRREGVVHALFLLACIPFQCDIRNTSRLPEYSRESSSSL